MDVFYIDFVYGILGVLLFRFRNPDENFQNIISVSLLGLFVSQLIYVHLNELTGFITWIMAAIGLSSSFLVRLKRKEVLTAIDYLKPLALILLIIYPLPFYYVLDGVWQPAIKFIAYPRPLTFLIVGMLFVYSRWILKPGFMKTKYTLAIIVVQSVMILLLLMHAFVQKAEAEKQHLRAEAEMQRAVEANEAAAKALQRAEEKLDSLRKQKAE